MTCQNCAVYAVFPSGMTSHSKIAQFNWQCIAPFKFMSGLLLEKTSLLLNAAFTTEILDLISQVHLA